MGEVKKRFGWVGPGSVRVHIKDGYIEVAGAAMSDRVRAPLAAVEHAVARRDSVPSGRGSRHAPVIVLIGKGAELGRAVVGQGPGPGLMRRAEEVAEWINAYLRATAGSPGTG